jgi:hypothetical protein
MTMKYLAGLALAALLLPACSASVNANSSADNSATSSAGDNSASDNSAASTAPSPADSSDPLAQYIPTFQKMEAGIDNNFSDLLTGKKDGQETIASIGFYPQYPCSVATSADKSKTYGYCIMGVSAKKSNADDDYAAAKQIVGKGDATLTEGTAPADPKTVSQAMFANDTHGVYLFETLQPNGKYLVKMTFAKPDALK